MKFDEFYGEEQRIENVKSELWQFERKSRISYTELVIRLFTWIIRERKKKCNLFQMFAKVYKCLRMFVLEYSPSICDSLSDDKWFASISIKMDQLFVLEIYKFLRHPNLNSKGNAIHAITYASDANGSKRAEKSNLKSLI